MAEKDNEVPNSASEMDKAEGERWTSDPDTVEVTDRYVEGVGETNEDNGGISNRELPEEMRRQQNLPDRGKSRRDQDAEQDGAEGDIER